MIRGKCFIAARQYIFLAGTCCMREGKAVVVKKNFTFLSGFKINFESKFVGIFVI